MARCAPAFSEPPRTSPPLSLSDLAVATTRKSFGIGGTLSFHTCLPDQAFMLIYQSRGLLRDHDEQPCHGHEKRVVEVFYKVALGAEGRRAVCLINKSGIKLSTRLTSTCSDTRQGNNEEESKPSTQQRKSIDNAERPLFECLINEQTLPSKSDAGFSSCSL